MAEDHWIPEYSFWIDPKQTLKFTLYKLMGVHAVSCVCELHPALYVPIFWSHYMLAHAISLIGIIVGSKGKKKF